jgi:hypothetical protein
MRQTSVYKEMIYFPVVLAAESKKIYHIHFLSLLPAATAATTKAKGFISQNYSPSVCPHFQLL